MRIPSNVTPSLKFQRDVPVCAHPTTRLLSTAEKSLHPQLPLVSPSQSQFQKHLWGSSWPKCTPTWLHFGQLLWVGKALGWQTLPVHCKITVLISPCEY